jgi:hypothetical protein
MTWLTPRRLKMATISIFVAAFGVSSIGLSGSSVAKPAARHAAIAHRH